MDNSSKQTPLHAWHLAQGANMADFGGYHMPLWYPSGVKSEHLSVILSAGLFDTSHMAVVGVQGPGSFDLLQRTFTRDLRSCQARHGPLEPGHCVYGAFLDENGHVMDDAIVYHVGENDYLIVVNAGMGAAISGRLTENAGGQVCVTDFTDQVGKMDIQGPASVHVLTKLLKNAANVFTGMAYFTFKGHFDPTSPTHAPVRLKDETPVLVSRTGYTGEIGFELFMPPDRLVSVWEMILDAGKSSDIHPCGLAARDSLRVGAGLPLSHQDIGPWPFIATPWDFALPWNPEKTGFTKSFLGSEALAARIVDPGTYTYPFAGYDLRKVAANHPDGVLDGQGNPIGTVLSCATDMAIGRHEGVIYSIVSPEKPRGFSPRGLSCGFIRVNRRLAPGETVIITDGRRKLKVEIVSTIRPARTARKPLDAFLSNSE